MQSQLSDTYGRRHSSLRVSVTDRCNIRCFYCMPLVDVQFRPRHELLTFEEITRVVRVAAGCGIRSVRLTGGEPLLRTSLEKLVSMLKRLDGIHDLALTTNGMLLADHAQALHDAGLDRLNVSLDTLNEQTFKKIARREGLARVLEGLVVARSVGFHRVRLNALNIRDLPETEMLDLVKFARQQRFELRFIEFMPLDAEQAWNRESVLSGAEVRRRIEAEFGQLLPVDRDDISQPAVDFQFADGQGRIGFINPVTEPFCGNCNRLRLTAEGQFRNCLFSTEEWDVRALLRSDASDDQVKELLAECVRAKQPGHLIDQAEFERPARAMYQIGG